MKWIDITDDLSEQGQRELEVGQVLFFEKLELKIMRKHKGKVWAKRVFMYKPDEVAIKDENKIHEV